MGWYRTLLQNEAYIGRWLCGTYSKQQTAPIEVAVPAIIEPELFSLARERAKKLGTR